MSFSSPIETVLLPTREDVNIPDGASLKFALIKQLSVQQLSQTYERILESSPESLQSFQDQLQSYISEEDKKLFLISTLYHYIKNVDILTPYSILDTYDTSYLEEKRDEEHNEEEEDDDENEDDDDDDDDEDDDDDDEKDKKKRHKRAKMEEKKEEKNKKNNKSDMVELIKLSHVPNQLYTIFQSIWKKIRKFSLKALVTSFPVLLEDYFIHRKRDPQTNINYCIPKRIEGKTGQVLKNEMLRKINNSILECGYNRLRYQQYRNVKENPVEYEPDLFQLEINDIKKKKYTYLGKIVSNMKEDSKETKRKKRKKRINLKEKLADINYQNQLLVQQVAEYDLQNADLLAQNQHLKMFIDKQYIVPCSQCHKSLSIVLDDIISQPGQSLPLAK